MDPRNPRDASDPTVFRMQEAYRWVQAVVADLTQEQLRWQPNVTTPAIRFHLFHIARWADVLQQIVAGTDHQVWHAEAVAQRWGLNPAMLGLGESGALIDEETAMALTLPDRDTLLAYCNRVLAQADTALASVDDEVLRRKNPYGGENPTIAAAIADQLSHTARHLGMIECLRGMQGRRGTASV